MKMTETQKAVYKMIDRTNKAILSLYKRFGKDSSVYQRAMANAKEMIGNNVFETGRAGNNGETIYQISKGKAVLDTVAKLYGNDIAAITEKDVEMRTHIITPIDIDLKYEKKILQGKAVGYEGGDIPTAKEVKEYANRMMFLDDVLGRLYEYVYQVIDENFGHGWSAAILSANAESKYDDLKEKLRNIPNNTYDIQGYVNKVLDEELNKGTFDSDLTEFQIEKIKQTGWTGEKKVDLSGLTQQEADNSILKAFGKQK